MNLPSVIYGLMDTVGDVFLSLLDMSAAAGVAILAVMLIRKILRRAPRWALCLLWALPALRLALPITPPNPFSLAPRMGVDQIETAGEVFQAPSFSSGVAAVDNAANFAIQRTFTAVSQSPALAEQARRVGPAALFGTVWACGCAALLAYLLFSFWRFRRRVRASVPLEKGVYLCDGVASPFILGVLRPRIYLPSALAEEHYPAILAHERAHLKRKDHWWKPLGFLLLAVHWFNPLVWAAYALLCRDIELACDEKVIRDGGAPLKKAYSEALLACAAPARGVAACPLAFGEVGVKARIKSVLSYKKPAVWLIVAALLAAAAIAFCFLTTPSSFRRQTAWNAVYRSGRVYLDPVVTPEKASRMAPFTVTLDDDGHMIEGHGKTTRDYGPADNVPYDYLWQYARAYAPALYRNATPDHASYGVTELSTYAQGWRLDSVIFQIRPNVFFYGTFVRRPDEEPELTSLCRLTRVGDYAREEQSPHWYWTVPVEGVRYIEVTGDFGTGLTCCTHYNEAKSDMTFDPDERVFLRCLDGMTDLSGLRVTGRDAYRNEMFSFEVPDTGSGHTRGNAYGLSCLEEDDPAMLTEDIVVMRFLTHWFTPDDGGRYTRFTEELRRGNLSEATSEAYFSAIRPLVTEGYYERIVMNRGYHSYDRNAADHGLTDQVKIPGVRLRPNGDGSYAFTVYLDQHFDGATAAGTIALKDGLVDGMYVSECTLGKQKKGGGETPTSYFYGDEETSAAPREWSTAVPPETGNG